MKIKFARLLGVGVTLALLASLLISAIPAAALSQPQVSVSDNVISKTGVTYTVIFTLAKDLPVGGSILVGFPATTGIGTATVTMQATSGIGSSPWVNPTAAAAAPVGTTTTLKITVPTGVVGETKIGMGAMVALTIAGVKNPDTAADYTLTVATETAVAAPIEAAVTSASYKIVVPTVPQLPGIASLYNTTGVLMTQKVGDNAIIDCINYPAGVGYTIQVGPGFYTTSITANVTSLTIKGTGATADLVTLKGTTTVSAAKVTLDNLTFDGGVVTSASDFTVKNSIFKNGADQLTIGGTPATVEKCTFNVTGTVAHGIVANAAATVKDCTFNVDADAAAIEAYATVTVSGCTITGASGWGIYVDDSAVKISKSTFKKLDTAIYVHDSYADVDGVTISDSTIEGCGSATTHAINVDYSDFFMYNCTVKDSNAANYALYAVDSDVWAWFNNITGNTKNVSGDEYVDVRHNWWGATTGPAAGSIVGGAIANPFAGASISAAVADYSAPWATPPKEVKTLDASTTVGIIVSAIDKNGALTCMDAVAVAKYSGNPQITAAPIMGTGSVVGYYDVFFKGDVAALQIKFVGKVSTYTKVYYGPSLSGNWVEPSSWGVNVAGGYAWVEVKGADVKSNPNLTDLQGTPFVVVEDKTTAPPNLGTPEVGRYDIPIAPTYTWSKVLGAIRYEIALSEDPTFAIVEWSYNVTNPFYKDTEELKYSTTYYWRVRGVLAEPYLSGPTWITPATPWAVGIFTTMAAPPPPEEPQEIIVPPADVTVEIPPTKITVEQPGPFIPEYLLWIIIAVGAVLIIALIVLIVRTRRAA